MTKYEMAVTDGRSDWLEYAEAGSAREARNIILQRFMRRGTPVEATTHALKVRTAADKKAPVGMAPHIATYLGAATKEKANA